MADDASLPIRLIADRQESQSRRIDAVEADVKDIPELRKEVQLMTEAFRQFRNASISATVIIVGAAVIVLLFHGGPPS